MHTEGQEREVGMSVRMERYMEDNQTRVGWTVCGKRKRGEALARRQEGCLAVARVTAWEEGI